MHFYQSAVFIINGIKLRRRFIMTMARCSSSCTSSCNRQYIYRHYRHHYRHHPPWLFHHRLWWETVTNATIKYRVNSAADHIGAVIACCPHAPTAHSAESNAPTNHQRNASEPTLPHPLAAAITITIMNSNTIMMMKTLTVLLKTSATFSNR